MIDFVGLFNTLTTALNTRGWFDHVSGHEPKAAPAPTGVSAAVWSSDLRPVRSSGLAAVSMRVEFTIRIYTSMLMEPQDEIDPLVLAATDATLEYLLNDFDLGATARYIDVFGMDGEGIRAQPGHLTQDGKPFRVIDIFLPIVINDVYTLA